MTYYNEIDPLKAEVIRVAIKAGAIAPGDVDERSIKDIEPADLVGYTQCHFFAGGGFWSLALRHAGWPDDRPVWTGSCPCPSFSAAGKGGGFDDPRHLWPDWFKLIGECRPPVILGEQADDAVGFGWLDLVQTDLEAKAYAVGKVVFGAHSVGAPHIRQRLYFCADAADFRHDGRRASETSRESVEPQRSRDVGECPNSEHDGHDSARGTAPLADSYQPQERVSDGDCAFSLGTNPAGLRRESVAAGIYEGGDGARVEPAQSLTEPRHDLADSLGGSNPLHTERRTHHVHGVDGRDGEDGGRQEAYSLAGARGQVLGSEHPLSAGLQGHFGDVRAWRGPGWLDPLTARSVAETGATRGFWADCDWWYGRDDKYRPIGPGLFPLAHGSPARVGRLRMFGDAIVVTQAQAFIETFMQIAA